jgi:hypothetical protein
MDPEHWIERQLRISEGFQKCLKYLNSGESEIREVHSGNSPIDLVDLQQRLACVDFIVRLKEGNEGSRIKISLYRLGDIRLVMRPEHNHQRPHFHIQYKREHAASYAVDTLECLAGSIPKKYEKPILEWASTNQQSLLVAWEKLQSGEDVRVLEIIET